MLSRLRGPIAWGVTSAGSYWQALVEAVLFPGFGSGSFPATDAVFAIGAHPLVVGCTTNLMVARFPAARLPMLHVTGGAFGQGTAFELPALNVADTKLRLGSRASVTITPVASDGPLFVAVIV